jgi:hypothetical protein
VWKRTVGGLVLTFHLAGINNQNFLMRDDQTGSFWQQVSGRAISGPLVGSQLEPLYSDELTFRLWRKVALGGTVLVPVARDVPDYETSDWDSRMAKTKTVLDFPKTPLKSRELVLGVELRGDSRAYEVSRVLRETLVQDRVGGEPVLLVVGPDGKSIRAFRARLEDGEAPDFFRKTNSSTVDATAPLFIDSQTGTEWNFDGCPNGGKYAGHCLALVPVLKDYWFDWRNYHPDTTIFRH